MPKKGELTLSLPETDEPETDTADPDAAEPDVPDPVDPDPETPDGTSSDHRTPPPRLIPNQDFSETGTTQGAPAAMAASIDKTLVAAPPNDQYPALDQPLQKQAVPLYKENPPPRYPGNARRRGHSGTVLLMVFVNEKGGG